MNLICVVIFNHQESSVKVLSDLQGVYTLQDSEYYFHSFHIEVIFFII
jgi:hypothetical protein